MTTVTLARKNPLQKLEALGQSVWLDYIRRSLIASGELRRLIEEDGVTGVTSNPAIFEKAIRGSTDYRDALARLKAQDLTAEQIYERLAIEDIRDAADVLRPVYERTRGRDGFVSLEVSPLLAHDRQRTVAEGLRLWKAVRRDNLMIKVPATAAGVGAIEDLTAAGLNVNATLLFSRVMYERAAWAYIKGLERRLEERLPVNRAAGVASVFVSRVDTAVDALLEEKLQSALHPEKRAAIESLMGKAAIANAKLAYQLYKDILRGDRWRTLELAGARPQRLLWASTGAKNPEYSDIMYVESLIGVDTVNTMPPATLDAFRDHGQPRATLEEDVGLAVDALRGLELLGISLDEVTDRVLDDGVRQFVTPYEKILDAVAPKAPPAPSQPVNRMSWSLPAGLERAVDSAVEDWTRKDKVRRLWARDTSLWTSADEDDWMGWLGLVEAQQQRLAELRTVAEKAREAGFTHALLLGMGGSSLAPEVLRRTFGRVEGYPDLRILDSTDPAQVRAAEGGLDLSRTLFIVSSKSGGTLEPNLFARYFLARAEAALGKEEAGRHFIAITDPGSKLEDLARQRGFRRVFHGLRSVGGRYSALSDFGLIPAAGMGLDAGRLLDRANDMVVACSSCVPARDNPAVRLGLLLGCAAAQGRDKLTLIASPGVASLGAWLEQLVAESTGKDGRAIIPVDREPLAAPESYGDDRLFVYLRLQTAPEPGQDAAVERLERAGYPVVRLEIAEPYGVAQEFFRWELGVAVAGSVLQVHPFNQPDVEAAKIAAHRLTERYETTGRLPSGRLIAERKGLRLFADDRNARRLLDAAGRAPTFESVLRAHLASLGRGDYFALLAYIPMTEGHEDELAAIRRLVLERKRVATCAGFGPRFQHSTGQAYKGGPPTGVFLQVTCDDPQDLPVPGKSYTFGVVKAAQAAGDLEVLAGRGRRALRVHLGLDAALGLEILREAIRESL
jgi:transaldolase/glucose-6-phosphate isomerase